MKKLNESFLDVKIDISLHNKNIQHTGFRMSELSLKSVSSLDIAAKAISKQFERELLIYLNKNIKVIEK